MVPQDFRNGKIDTAFIPKHEKELAAVSIQLFHLLCNICSFFRFLFRIYISIELLNSEQGQSFGALIIKSVETLRLL